MPKSNDNLNEVDDSISQTNQDQLKISDNSGVSGIDEGQQTLKNHKKPGDDLKLSDAEINLDQDPVIKAKVNVKKPSKMQRLKALLKSKKFWIIFVLSLTVLLIALWFIQPARIWLVNLLGVRTNLSITVLTPAEGQQQEARLKNVNLKVNGRDFTTNNEGVISITDQPLGGVTLKATKSGYAEAQTQTYLDFDPFFHLFGGNQADLAARHINIEMKSVGVALSFVAKDWLSGQPITSGEYVVGDLRLKAGSDGRVSFKTPYDESGKIKVSSDLNGQYIDKSFDMSLSSKETPEVKFVPAGKHYFVSKRSGALSIYSSNLDGSGVELVIPGTGLETSQTAFAVAPSGKYGILASAREGKRSESGELLTYLYIVDLEKKILTKVDEGRYINMSDWSDDNLIYKVAPVTNSNDLKLKVVDITNATATEISQAWGYGRIIVSFGQVFYTQDNPNDDGATVTIAKVYNINNKSHKDLGSKVDYGVVQPDFDRVVFKNLDNQKWYEYNFNTGQLKDSSQPTEQEFKTFLSATNLANTKRIMLDKIDGKFTIIVKNTADGVEKQLYGARGLGGPIRWIGDVIVFRIVDNLETADYAVSINGGDPKKISDITATIGTDDATADNEWFRYY